MAFEKPRAGAKAILRRLWRYLYHYKWLLAAAVALSLTGNLLALAGPKLSGYAIDAIRPGPGRVDFNTVFHYAKRMLVFYFAAAALSYVLATLMVRLSRNVVYRMRKDIYDHLMRLPVRFFDTHAIGDVLSVLSYDVDTINASLSNDLVQMLTSVITVAGSFGMMLSISPQLILIFVVTIPISVMFTRHRSKRVRPLYRRRSAGLGALNGFAEEMTGGLKTIKAYGREEVVGVLMPEGLQPDTDYSNGLVDVLGLRHITFNIHGGTAGILEEMERVGMTPSRQTKVNLPSRMRMATLYAVAQSVERGIVLNTSNLSEDWVGYCTIYGDSAGAFSPLGMYTTEEVIALGRELGLPEKFLLKPPSDGLTGLTDEDNLGFSYHAVNEYIRTGKADPEIRAQIDQKHAASRFKFETMPLYHNGLPIVIEDGTDYYK